MKSYAMRTNLRIKRRTQAAWLLQIVVLLPLLRAVLTEYLGLPSAIDYVLDLVWAALLLYLICSPGALRQKRIAPMLLWIALFFAYTLAAHLPRLQSPLYYLWGVRNNFRFYVAFLGFCVFMDREDGDRHFVFMDVLFWLNLALTLFQYAKGYRYDFLGGIFGTEIGCNAYTNIFMLIVVTRSLIACFNRKESFALCAAKCVTALLVAALAELKFFFVEFLFVTVLVYCITGFTVRKILIALVAAVGILASYAIFARIYPHFADTFIPRRFFEISAGDQGYTLEGDFNRLTAISRTNQEFLHTVGERLFGLGLGNCETSSLGFLNTPFADAHADRTHYNWFSTSFVYLETGWIGLVFYFGFFGLVFLRAHIQQRSGERIHCQLAKVMALCCILLGTYNVSLRTEAGYLVYFVLALPFVKNGNPPERTKSYDE